jgi:hypothetical protein
MAAAAEEQARAARAAEGERRAVEAAASVEATATLSRLSRGPSVRGSVGSMLQGQAFLELLQDEEVDSDERVMLREKARLRLLEEAHHVKALRAEHSAAQVGEKEWGGWGGNGEMGSVEKKRGVCSIIRRSPIDGRASSAS